MPFYIFKIFNIMKMIARYIYFKQNTYTYIYVKKCINVVCVTYTLKHINIYS